MVVIGQMILFSFFIKEFNKPLIAAALGFVPTILYIIYFGFKTYLHWDLDADAISHLDLPLSGGIAVSVIVGLTNILDE